jgi:sugar lactone lactonase YvrE
LRSLRVDFPAAPLVMKAELIFDARALLGKGALWHEDRLLWIDIEGCTVNRFDPRAGRNESWPVGQRVGTVVPRAGRGELLVAVHRGLGILDPATGLLELFADPAGGRPEMRFNDGKCDPCGRFFAGTMGLEKPRAPGTLYRLDPGRTITPVLTGLGTSNGLAWSADQRTMYFIDTPTYEVSAFDYDPDTGAMTNRRPAVKFPSDGPGRPDGMVIDADGNLWVAMYEGAGVLGCDPRTGRVIARIDVPARKTTSCTFGGPELRDLYITCARTEGEPHTGALWIAHPGVCGVPALAFGG